MEDKSKIIFMNTVLKNPVLGKKLMEAWDAPIGSTKRDQARSMLSSIKKATYNKYSRGEDGQGGVGDTSTEQDPYRDLMNATNTPINNSLKVWSPSAPVTLSNTKPGAAKNLWSGLMGGIHDAAADINTGIRGAASATWQGTKDAITSTSPGLTAGRWLSAPDLDKYMKYQAYLDDQGTRNLTFKNIDAQ